MNNITVNTQKESIIFTLENILEDISEERQIPILKELRGLKNIRYIKYYEGENNYYDDSNFYSMYLDLKDKKIIKNIWGTTRCAGINNTFVEENKLEISDLTIQSDFDLLEQIAEKEIDKESLLRQIGFKAGETVKVTNTRARKFKGETFKITKIQGCYYDRNKTYLFGVDANNNPIKTSKDNCSLIEYDEQRFKQALESAISRKVYGY